MDNKKPVQKVSREQYAGAAKFAMSLSLAIGIGMLGLKMYGYLVTGSAAILSDAAESVVHNIAVGFAFYSLRLSLKPPDKDHIYGHDKISFFSAGFEGMMIAIAGIFIIYESIHKWLSGLELQNLGVGIWVVTIATVVNGVLGFYLVHRGRKYHMMVLEANGKHVLTDSWTSLGVIGGLLLTSLTGWKPFDPIVAIIVATNILFMGTKLMRRSIGGLMDETDPEVDQKLQAILKEGTERFGIGYHHLRHRNAGNKLLVEFHLTFRDSVTVAEAHENATVIEQEIHAAFPFETEVLSHLEPTEAHDTVHKNILDGLGEGPLSKPQQ